MNDLNGFAIDARRIVELQATIREQDKVIKQRNIMCSDYFEGHTTNMKRIAELQAKVEVLTAVLCVLGTDEDFLDNERYLSAEAFFEAEVRARKDYARAALKENG